MHPWWSYDEQPSASALVTRIVGQRRAALRGGPARVVRCGRASPIDYADPFPLHAAFLRSLQAALAGHPCPSV